jgi:hypothetical protein
MLGQKVRRFGAHIFPVIVIGCGLLCALPGNAASSKADPQTPAALMSYLPMHPKAQASTLPECTTINRRSCDPSIPGMAQCYWYTAEEPGSCTCNPATSKWVCDIGQ